MTKYKIFYNQLGGSSFNNSKFEELPDNTVFRLRSNDDKTVNISKTDLLKYPESFLTILVTYSVMFFNGDNIIDLVIPITSFNEESLKNIVFFYQNDYWNFNSIKGMDGEVPDKMEDIPLIKDNDYLELNTSKKRMDNLLSYLALPNDTTYKNSNQQDESNYDYSDEYDDQYHQQEESLQSWRSRRLEHRFMNEYDKHSKYDYDY